MANLKSIPVKLSEWIFRSIEDISELYDKGHIIDFSSWIKLNSDYPCAVCQGGSVMLNTFGVHDNISNTAMINQHEELQPYTKFFRALNQIRTGNLMDGFYISICGYTLDSVSTLYTTDTAISEINFPESIPKLYHKGFPLSSTYNFDLTKEDELFEYLMNIALIGEMFESEGY